MSLPPGSLTFGTATLGNLHEAMSDAEAQALLETAWESGIHSFDTAPHYGLGLSEKRLGDFVGSMPAGSVRVSTKVGRLLLTNPSATARDTDMFEVPGDLVRVWDFSADGVRTSVSASLERLQLDRVHTLYLHDPEKAPEPASAVDSGLWALADLRDENLVTLVGVGSMDEGSLVAGAVHEATDVLMVAGRHTLLDHTASSRVLPLCHERGVSVAATAIYNSGLLAAARPAGRFDYSTAPAEVLARAERLADVCTAHGTDLPTAALHYSALHPRVSSIVFGARTPDQIRQNVERAQSSVDPGLWDALVAESLIPPVVP